MPLPGSRGVAKQTHFGEESAGRATGTAGYQHAAAPTTGPSIRSGFRCAAAAATREESAERATGTSIGTISRYPYAAAAATRPSSGTVSRCASAAATRTSASHNIGNIFAEFQSAPVPVPGRPISSVGFFDGGR